MKSDIPLDCAVFQLSPKRSRCELFVSCAGTTEKLASGLVNPFVTNLKVAEEQVARSVKSIKLEVEREKQAVTWFTKGTLERFVRFVSTPEILDMVHTYDAEMSQLEAACRIYSQGSGDRESGGDGTAMSDATKKELLRAIDVRLVAVRQDLTTACTRASAAGFNPDTVAELQLFADQFGAEHLGEACSKFRSLCQRRPDIFTSWKPGIDDHALRFSSGSDMSIDDPSDDPQTRSHDEHQQQLDQLNSMSQPANNKQPSSVSFPLHCSSMSANSSKETDDICKNEDKYDKKEEAEPEISSIQATQPMRRLSVQDRINMFESKQKENSSSSSSVSKPVVGKSIELRRLSSDVSSGFEKAVLRRWSGASDMSIDLNIERREPDSNASTPSSPVVLQAHTPPGSLLSSVYNMQRGTSNGAGASVLAAKPDSQTGIAGGVSSDNTIKDQGDFKDVDYAKKEEVKAKVSGRSFSAIQVETHSGGGPEETHFAGGPQDSFSGSMMPSVSGISENEGRKGQSLDSIAHSRAAFNGARKFGLENRTAALIQFKSSLGKPNQFGSTIRANEKKLKVAFGSEEQTLVVEQAVSGSQFKENGGDVARKEDGKKSHSVDSESRISAARSDGEDSQVLAAEGGDITLLNQHVRRSQFRASKSASVDVNGLDSEDRSQNKGAGDGSVAARPEWKSFAGVDREGSHGHEPVVKQLDPSLTEVENCRNQKMKFQRHGSMPEFGKKARGTRDEGGSVVRDSQVGIADRRGFQSEGAFSSVSALPMEQVQRVRQSKGLNDDLKMKAYELENLFAEHKLCVPGDQSNLSRRGKHIDTKTKQEASPLQFKTELEVSPGQLTGARMVAESPKSSSNMNGLVTTPMKMLGSQYSDGTPKQNIYSHIFSDGSRGIFYDRYMQKRDAKLTEEWSLRRPEKEARMKVMHDSLERSSSELNTRLAVSSNRRDATSHARQRAEKFRSVSARTMRRQQPIATYISVEDEDHAENPGIKPHKQDGMSREGSSRSVQTKNLGSNKNMVSSTSHALGSAASHLSMKASNAFAGRRKLQSENPLAQSVPNFCDLRKEDTKPSSGSSKTTTRQQVRSYDRNKSGSEEKPRSSQFLRKSSANAVELIDFDGINLASLNYDKVETECTDEFSSNNGVKPFLIEGNSVHHVSISGISECKSSEKIETLNNEDDESVGGAKEEDDDFIMVGEDYPNVEKGEPRMSQGSYKSVNSGSGNSNAARCVSQADSASVAELPLVTEPAFHAMSHVQASAGESSGSWNAQSHNPYSISNVSDVDASVDSPIGSPAYWISHSIAHTETEAASMRKKWGAAQKPVAASDSSHGQSRRDVTKGFKRFLKFGRKSRATEDGADWISATTSEGDDDTEDGRDPANHSSEDLRKSRMGFSHGHTSDDGFNETDFKEQVQVFHCSIPAPPTNFKLRDEHLSGSSLKAPRSFFSLPSFRSKGSDPKPAQIAVLVKKQD
ncbi:hypothetical protein Dimus_027437 [Dionaea muscipula]